MMKKIAATALALAIATPAIAQTGPSRPDSQTMQREDSERPPLPGAQPAPPVPSTTPAPADPKGFRAPTNPANPTGADKGDPKRKIDERSPEGRSKF